MKWLPVLLPVLHGCALNCTEMGCQGGITVYLLGTAQDGEWSFEMEKDGVTSVCNLTLPDGEPVCSSPLEVSVDSEGITVTWVTMMGETGTLAHLRASRDGTLLIDEDVPLEWSAPVYPNGKACDDGMGCSNASTNFAI